jgi:hypothetical protein
MNFIATIKAWIIREEQTVESLVAKYTSAARAFEKHAEAKAKEVLFHNEVAMKAEELAVAAQTEATKAQQIAKQVSALFNA